MAINSNLKASLGTLLLRPSFSYLVRKINVTKDSNLKWWTENMHYLPVSPNFNKMTEEKKKTIILEN